MTVTICFLNDSKYLLLLPIFSNAWRVTVIMITVDGSIRSATFLSPFTLRFRI
jgi:hypothetical protein